MLWRRLGLNRAIDVDNGGSRPQLTTSKRKGESTVYLIKLPPQSHYYATLNHLGPAEQFKKVSMDFTANGKPAGVYHWNLPMSPVTIISKTTTIAPTMKIAPTTTIATTATTPATPMTPRKKTYLRTHLHNNGKPDKIYLVKKESFIKERDFKQT